MGAAERLAPLAVLLEKLSTVNTVIDEAMDWEKRPPNPSPSNPFKKPDIRSGRRKSWAPLHQVFGIFSLAARSDGYKSLSVLHLATVETAIEFGLYGAAEEIVNGSLLCIATQAASLMTL